MDDIKVSVIVPIYNVEEYLEECLISLEKQTLKDIEVLMIDDGSTDHSASIAKKFEKRHSNFHYFYKENGGLGNARNYAIPYVKGQYLIFLDSDDVVPEYAYEKMYNLAVKTGNDMIIGNVKRFNSKKVYDSVMLHKKVFVEDLEHTHILENPKLIYDTTSWNKLFKTSFYKENNFKFPEKILYEDIPVTIPAHFKANSVGVLTDVCYLWRTRDGVSKSITQNRTEIKNFTDRIKIMDMVNDFYAKNVTDKTALLMKDFKWLDIDLKLYVNQMQNSTDEFNQIAFKEINRYLDQTDETAFNMLHAIDKLKYFYIRKNDIDGLRNILKYQKTGYKVVTFKRKDNSYIADFPMKDIDFKLRDVTQEINYYPLSQTINNVTFIDNKLYIDFSMYISKLKKQSDFRVNAYLYSKATKNKLAISISRKKLRKTVFKLSRHPLKISKYDYSDCNYQLVIDLNEPQVKEMIGGQTYIMLNYFNDVINKEFILSNSKNINNVEKSVVFDKGILKTNLINNGYLMLQYFNDVNVIDEISFDEQKLTLKNCTEQVSLLNDTKQLLTKSQNLNQYIDLDNIDNGNYEFFILKDSSKENIYYSGNCHYYIGKNKFLLLNVNKDRQIQFKIEDNTKILISNYEIKNSKIYLTVVTANKKLIEKSQLVFENTKYNYKLYFKYNFFKQKENILYINYVLDLNSKDIYENLASGSYEIYLQSNPVTIYDCISVDNLSIKKFKINDLTIGFTVSENKLSLNVVHHRTKLDNSKTKRRLMKKYIYPILRLLPMSTKTIVFEDWWGEKYHCNPRFLYEYINKNYQNYKCVWFLNDDRIPINGNAKRIRRKSFKYYYYLSTAKYFVNNVNFHDEYVKRKHQVEVQTMHGTPLKTLGLDVPGELNTPKKRENFLRRCNRWDYLVVQSDKASQITSSCYAFKKEFLRTGYPRNDILFEKNNERDIKALKEKIGIPEGKKVITYSPTWRRRNYFEMHLNLEDMKETFGHDYVLLLRIHPFAYAGFDKSILNDFVINVSAYESIEELYLISDIVITDYSSVMFDYTILNRPILFFTYDLLEYRDNLRGFNFDFEKEAPGPLLNSYEEVKDAIIHIDKVYNKYYEMLQKFRNKFNEYEQGNASQQICEKFLK